MKKKLIFFGAIALFLMIVGVCLLQINSLSHTLISQRAAEVWQGESKDRFAQVTAILPLGKEIDENTIWSFRQTIDPRLRDDGVEIPKQGSVWADAYSGMGSLTVSGNKGAYPATVVGVGGDFFLFHPYELMSGSYITDDDVMQDRVVLDQDLAWKLFGGFDLAGMSVTIGGKPYYVAGVIRRESDTFTIKAFSGEPLIFMSYSAASENVLDFGISCYELVMPDPISNYVETFVTDNFASGSAVVVQNTGRYSFGRILDIFEDFGRRVINDTGAVYPYWENAARVSEDYVARLYVIIAVAGLIPFICLVWLLVILTKFLIRKLKYGQSQVKEAWDDRYARMDDLKQKARRRRDSRAADENYDDQSDLAVFENPFSDPAQLGDGAYDENAVAMDIESIVREIMDEDK